MATTRSMDGTLTVELCASVCARRVDRLVLATGGIVDISSKNIVGGNIHDFAVVFPAGGGNILSGG